METMCGFVEIRIPRIREKDDSILLIYGALDKTITNDLCKGSVSATQGTNRLLTGRSAFVNWKVQKECAAIGCTCNVMTQLAFFPSPPSLIAYYLCGCRNIPFLRKIPRRGR